MLDQATPPRRLTATGARRAIVHRREAHDGRRRDGQRALVTASENADIVQSLLERASAITSETAGMLRGLT